MLFTLCESKSTRAYIRKQRVRLHSLFIFALNNNNDVIRTDSLRENLNLKTFSKIFKKINKMYI